MRQKITYYFTYELRSNGTSEAKRGGLVFKSASIHPETFVRSTLWPAVIKLEPEFSEVKYRDHQIHDWPFEDVVYQPIDFEDKETDF